MNGKRKMEAIIVEKGKAKEFLKLLESQKTTKTYWDECLRTNKNLSSDDTEKLKKKLYD